MTTSKNQAGVSRRPLLTGAGLAGAGTGMCSGPGWLSFRRIVDIPFQERVAALESWQLQGHHSELPAGQSRLRGPAEHDRVPGPCRVEVRLARGPLRPPLRMRLDIDRWSASSTALELIPCRLVRPTADYFRAGRLLLDSLTRSVSQRPDPRVTQSIAS